MAGLDVRSILGQIQAPTLVLHRIGDRVVDVRQGRAVADAIPRATFIEPSGNDHIPFLGDVDTLVDHIEELLTGVRPSPEPDRMLATVLFTDIVGSTERAAGMGDRPWRDLLAQHNRIVREALERHRGREIGTAGDGFLATFDGPARAIRCVREISLRLRDFGLQVRAGVHTGEVERLGDDIGGIAVHIGARVTALAGAGEVFVSRTVVDLVAGSGLAFEDRGEHNLKGVPGTWKLFAVAN